MYLSSHALVLYWSNGDPPFHEYMKKGEGVPLQIEIRGNPDLLGIWAFSPSMVSKWRIPPSLLPLKKVFVVEILNKSKKNNTKNFDHYLTRRLQLQIKMLLFAGRKLLKWIDFEALCNDGTSHKACLQRSEINKIQRELCFCGRSRGSSILPCAPWDLLKPFVS